ncbi:MAG: class I SAM-dependent methyltransferase [Chloroflexi bacterium]|nr:class I SAM-dependent methyltransferase [Chloroflexota bacterium]
MLIARAVRHWFRRYFADEAGKVYLHAGCGSGESDGRIGFERATFVLMDIAPDALRIARARTNLPNAVFVVGDIFRPPFRPGTIDGVWNLGVMEHFHEPGIERAFAALAPVMRPGSRGLIFWPPRYGSSVIGLGLVLFVLNQVLRRRVQFFPDEVSRFWTRSWAQRLLRPSGLIAERTHFSVRDLFTYVVLVIRRPAD